MIIPNGPTESTASMATVSNASSVSSNESGGGRHSPLVRTDRRQMIQNGHVLRTNQMIRTARCDQELVIGIVYVRDTIIGDHHNKTGGGCSNELSLGTLVLEDYPLINANVLRENIQKNLFKMDENYVFITKFGTPISIDQETNLEIVHLMNQENVIKFKRKLFNCSVIGYYSGCGIFIGYIETKFDSNLKNIRTKITEILNNQCTVTANYLNLISKMDYYFLHDFKNIIPPGTETEISVIEIINNNNIFIQFEQTNPIPENYSRYLPLDTAEQSNRIPQIKSDLPVITEDPNDSQSGANLAKSRRKISLVRRKTSKHRSTMKMDRKLIMISYVRREATQHALDLKKKLTNLGFSVYLDVHEIQTGSDWQDSLNTAVQNCQIFVPLITPNYGKTQWTNREVKLADLLNKQIIPINFQDIWPPECLAIQFATIHYIPWNPIPGQDGQDNNDINVWNEKSIDEVTKLIKELVDKLGDKINKDNNNAGIIEISPVKPASPIRSKNKLIVISVHPKQNDIAQKIKNDLSNEFEVWCSTDVGPDGKQIINENKDEQRQQSGSYEQDLPPIPENLPAITQPVKDYARYIAKNSKQRPKSVPNNEHPVDEIEKSSKKNPVSRGSSCGLNNERNLSSISPTKMAQLEAFKDKVGKAELVIIIASEDYYVSNTSKELTYYCGQRVENIVVECSKRMAPVWFSNLMLNTNHVDYESRTFESELKSKIDKLLDPQCKVMEMHDDKIQSQVDCIKRNLPDTETCIYVFGSTDIKEHNQRTVDICKEIGKELAKISNLNIVTNGFYGTGDLIAYTFYQERCQKRTPETPESVIHIVPLKDEKIFKEKCRQNTDGTFEKVSYGKTFFFCDSIRERDMVIARLFNTAVLIGGDEDNAREVQEFLWKDHYVIPIKSTGGAAGGEYGVSSKIFCPPNGVQEKDWAVLSNLNATPSQVAKALAKIIFDLKTAIHDQAGNKNYRTDTIDKPIKFRTAKRSDLSHSSVNQDQEPPAVVKRLPTVVRQPSPSTSSIGSTVNSTSSRISRLGGRIRRFWKLLGNNSKHTPVSLFSKN